VIIIITIGGLLQGHYSSSNVERNCKDGSVEGEDAEGALVSHGLWVLLLESWGYWQYEQAVNDLNNSRCELDNVAVIL
jgi:hypothetical protein